MKRAERPVQPETAKPPSASDSVSVLGRLTLASLDDCPCEKQGYDPYDTSSGRVPDVWAAKRKRA
jgi:hypothetical protein